MMICRFKSGLSFLFSFHDNTIRFMLLVTYCDGLVFVVGLELTQNAITLMFNTLRPRENGRHFADDSFKCIFVNENL